MRRLHLKLFFLRTRLKREAQGVTAKILGVRPATMSHLEQGRSLPTLPMLPRTHGYYDLSLDVDTYHDTRMASDCCFTAPFTAAGSPAISVPMSWSTDGLRIGVQFVGRDDSPRRSIEAALARLEA